MRGLIAGLLVAWPAALAAQPIEDAAIDLTDLEARVHAEVNAFRATHDVPPLAYDPALADIARAHSQAMIDDHFFDHVDPAGRTPTDRATRSGYTCPSRLVGENTYTDGSVGENILETHRYRRFTTLIRNGVSFREYEWKSPDELASEIVQLWSESPGHRANLLLPSYHLQGLGIVMADDLRISVTQNFC